MSNAVDVVVKKEAVDGVNQLISVLTQADELILKFSSDALAFNNNISKIKTPADLSGQAARNKQITEQITVAINEQQKVEKALITTIEKKSIAVEGTNRALIKHRIELNNTNKEIAKQARETLGLVSSYDKLSNELTTLRNQAKATAVTFGLESEEFKKQAAAVQVLDAKLKKIDETLGQSQRNVGNYKSGFNGLGNSINQLTREAPAFAVSLNTGFLALSNNLPILADELARVRRENVELAKSGQPTVSVFRQLLGSLFSFQTLLSVGVTLLTLYGGKIIDYISGADKTKKAQEELKKATEAKIEAEKRQNQEIASTIAAETNKARILFEIAKNEENTAKQRNKAADELLSRYPEYLGALTKQQILAGQTAEAEERLNQALVNRGLALATQSLLQKNAEEQIVVQLEAEKVYNASFKAISKTRDATTGAIISSNGYSKAVRQTSLANAEAARIEAEKLKPLKEEQALLLSIFNANSKYLDIVKETTGKNKEAKRAKTEEIGENLKAADATKGLIEQLEAFVKELEAEQRLVTTSKEQFDEYQKTIDRVKFSIQGLTTGYNALKNGSKEFTDEFTRQTKGAENLQKSIAILRAETEAYLETFSKDFVSNGALSSLTTFFDGTFQKLLKGAEDGKEKFAVAFESITEAAQQAYNLISEASQKNFDAEYERLESQKNIAIAFAGESDVAKAEIERQAEQRRKEIEKREQKVKQEAAVVNTVINTAQAIVSALATANNIYAGIALAAFAAATGAAQIAIIKSQKVSAYWQGGTHDGGLMRVNDDPMRVKGANYREVVKTPDGLIHRPQGRDVLMNAPKGTEIYKDEDAFQKSLNVMLNNAGVDPIRNYEKAVVNVATQPALTETQVGRIVQAIQSQPVPEVFIENGEFRNMLRTNNRRQEIMNSRATQKGFTTRG